MFLVHVYGFVIKIFTDQRLIKFILETFNMNQRLYLILLITLGELKCSFKWSKETTRKAKT
jgi:hypothetical protein